MGAGSAATAGAPPLPPPPHAGGAWRPVLGWTWRLAGHDVVELVAVDGFPLQQGLGHGVHLVLVVLDQLARQRVLLVDDAAHLGVHLLHGLFAHVGGLGHRAAQEHFALVFGIDHRAQRVGHAVAGHHVAGDGGRPLEVVAGTGRHLVHEHLFGDAAAKQHADLVQHVFVVVAVAVLRRQAHGHAQRTAARDDGDLVHRVALGQQLADQRMAGLVVRGP